MADPNEGPKAELRLERGWMREKNETAGENGERNILGRGHIRLGHLN